MLTCREAVVRLGEPLDDEPLRHHLAGCAECTAFRNTYETTRRLAMQLARLPPLPDARLMRRRVLAQMLN
jgi:hypothetical protein